MVKATGIDKSWTQWEIKDMLYAGDNDFTECWFHLKTMEAREQWNSFQVLSEDCTARILHEIKQLSKVSAKTFADKGHKEFTGDRPVPQDMTTGIL